MTAKPEGTIRRGREEVTPRPRLRFGIYDEIFNKNFRFSPEISLYCDSIRTKLQEKGLDGRDKTV